MLRGFLPRYYADDDGTGSGGSGAGDDQGKVKPSDILARYGQTAESALRMAEKLAESENSNYGLREKNRTLRTEVTELKAKTPADGARILTADEAKSFEAFTALGKKPDEIKTALDASSTTATELATLKRKQQLHDVQALTGFDPDVLGEIGPDWQYTFKDEQADGKPVKVVYIKDGDNESRIDEHAKVLKFLPALRPAAGGTGTGEQGGTQQRGTAFVQQHAGGGGATGDKAAQFIAQQEATRKTQTNPLMKPQGA